MSSSDPFVASLTLNSGDVLFWPTNDWTTGDDCKTEMAGKAMPTNPSGGKLGSAKPVEYWSATPKV